MTGELRNALDEARRYAGAVQDALDVIYDRREAGELVPLATLQEIEVALEDCCGHEALADQETFA